MLLTHSSLGEMGHLMSVLFAPNNILPLQQIKDVTCKYIAHLVTPFSCPGNRQQVMEIVSKMANGILGYDNKYMKFIQSGMDAIPPNRTKNVPNDQPITHYLLGTTSTNSGGMTTCSYWGCQRIFNSILKYIFE